MSAKDPLTDESYLVLPPLANLVLSESYERIFHPPTATFADIPRGVFLVRGENVVLIGEVVRPPLRVCICIS